MKLSILVCTLSDRYSKFKKLLMKLDEQAVGKPVEIIYMGDNKHRTTGHKRNDLLSVARGEYVSFVDDDDDVSDDYVDAILAALESGDDVINFMVKYHCLTFQRPVYYSTKNLRDENLPDKFLRIPNHLMVVKRALALGIKYPDITFGEDADYAKRLLPSLITETNINKVLYHYLDYK